MNLSQQNQNRLRNESEPGPETLNSPKSSEPPCERRTAESFPPSDESTPRQKTVSKLVTGPEDTAAQFGCDETSKTWRTTSTSPHEMLPFPCAPTPRGTHGGIDVGSLVNNAASDRRISLKTRAERSDRLSAVPPGVNRRETAAPRGATTKATLNRSKCEWSSAEFGFHPENIQKTNIAVGVWIPPGSFIRGDDYYNCLDCCHYAHPPRHPPLVRVFLS